MFDEPLSCKGKMFLVRVCIHNANHYENERVQMIIFRLLSGGCYLSMNDGTALGWMLKTDINEAWRW